MQDPILVTGGAGYVGSHAAKALALHGFTPVVFDDFSTGNEWATRWGPVHRGDILDQEALHAAFELYKPAGVMHFAADALVGESMRIPHHYYRKNMTGSLNVLDACRHYGHPPVIFSSTCAIYGTPRSIPITEDTIKEPVNPYGASKAMVEQMLRDFARAYQQPYAALRYFNAAGADLDLEIGECREKETHLIPLAVDAILGYRPPLKVLGTDYPTPDGTAIRDYIHVSDLARAHVLALRHLLAGGGSLEVNLGTGKGYSVREIIDSLAQISGQAVPHTTAERRPGDPAELIADASKASSLLGFEAGSNSGLSTIIKTAWEWGLKLKQMRKKD